MSAIIEVGEGATLAVSNSYLLEVPEVFSRLRTSADGLSNSDVISRLAFYGRNTLEKHEKNPWLKKFLGQFKEPLILLLLGSAATSLLLGQIADCIGILIAVFIVNVVGFLQESKSEKSLEALQSLTAPRCRVIRAGLHKEINAEDLVPGDLVTLSVGDRIPADLRLTQTVNLQIDESILTGETHATLKTSKSITTESNDVLLAKRKNIAHQGTVVIAGNGKGVVIATGAKTELGKISEMIQQMEESKTPLQVKMDEIGKQLSILAFCIVGVIFVIGALQGKNLLQMFTTGVRYCCSSVFHSLMLIDCFRFCFSLAVAAIPEGLPIVVTVTLALGVTRMAGRNGNTSSLFLVVK